MTKIEYKQIRALEPVKFPYMAKWTINFVDDMVVLADTNSAYPLSAKQKNIIENLIYKYRKQIPDWKELTAIREAAKRQPRATIPCGVFKREQRETPLFDMIQNVCHETKR